MTDHDGIRGTRKWGKIKRLFAEAARLDRPQRDLYLKQTCREPEIRREVESLLDQHDKSENFPGVYSSVGGRTLSHYDIHERIGEGGIAVVYKARDTVLNRWVALKVLQPWAMGHPAAQPQLIAEARAASALNHANIVTIHEVANDGDVWFIVMEYILGKTLNRWIPAAGLPQRQALHCATQIADALVAAHAAGIVHGDLKPLNVMVTDAGHVKLLDFGLAVALGGRTDPPTALSQFGTKAYMAPAQLQGHGVGPDPRSDIFSFGLILYQILTGRHPFRGTTRAELVDAIRNKEPEPLPLATPAPLTMVVAHCIEKDVEKRFQSMREVKSALTGYARTKQTSYSTGAKLPAATPARRRSAQSEFLDGESVSDIRAIAQRLGLDNIPRSRQALKELGRVIESDMSPEIREAIMPTLKEFLQMNADFGGNGIPLSIRALRREALELVNSLTQGQLGLCFEDRDLNDLDLYGMNFAGNRLSEFNFRRCFLVEADFHESDLTEACFVGANVRNANFASANLSGADFGGADWFNALGLTQGQLQSARRDTLLACPATIQAMFRYLANHYLLPFESWPEVVQEQLKAAWFEYLKPGGLCHITLEWRRRSDQ